MRNAPACVHLVYRRCYKRCPLITHPPPGSPPMPQNCPADPSWISLQIVLHKNLMRLRHFMANPDQPIPDAPKDWMPPMPRPDTPPAEESDHDSDSADEVSQPLGDRDATSWGVRLCCCVEYLMQLQLRR